MWVTTHVLAGLAIAAALGGPWWLILVLVLLAHVVMDLIPHWDYTVTRHPVLYGCCDFCASLGAFLAAALLLGYPWWIAFMGLASGAPDWDVLIATARGHHARKFFPSHWQSFPHGRSGRAWGIGVQVAIMAASVAVVLAARPL
jgi:hypothetical protein